METYEVLLSDIVRINSDIILELQSHTGRSIKFPEKFIVKLSATVGAIHYYREGEETSFLQMNWYDNGVLIAAGFLKLIKKRIK